MITKSTSSNWNSPNLNPEENLRHDLFAGITVFLVAIPLCLGIAYASGAPMIAGLVAGIIGGTLVAFLSGSALGVSGPAAGLVVICYTGIEELTFPVFLLAVIFAGIIQFLLGKLRAGVVGYYFPSAVISGMLYGIGLIIFLKQIPHAIGYDRDYEGDLGFSQLDGYTTLSELEHMVSYISPVATGITLTALVILLAWEAPFVKRSLLNKLAPASFVVVVVGIIINQLVSSLMPQYALDSTHLVSIPTSEGGMNFFSHLVFPDFSQWDNMGVYRTGFILAVVASLETLLTLEATDKLDPYKRTSSASQELVAQGIGNVACGFLGGLPVSKVIVRSSVNIQAGGKTKNSVIIYGVLLLISVLLLPDLINMIPLSSLSAMLLLIGIKLAHPMKMVAMYRSGPYHFVPFMATIVGLIFTDLFTGIAIGLVLAVLSILRENFRMGMYFHKKKRDNKTIIHLSEHVSFLNKANLLQMLNQQSPGSELIIDATGSKFIDYDVKEIIENFKVEALEKDIDFKLIEMPQFHIVKDKTIQENMTPDDALELLKHGNRRFVNNLNTHHDLLTQVNITSAGQFPFAIILSCIDSRTSAELIFDLGLGDIFSARIAGNVVNADILGSMEFACKLAGSKLIVVLGHSHCGAIKGACADVEMGNLTGLLEKIKPSVEKARHEYATLSGDDFADMVAKENVRQARSQIIADSRILREMYENKQINIIGGMYDINSGVVNFYNQ